MNAHTPGPWHAGEPIESGAGKQRHVVYVQIFDDSRKERIAATSVYPKRADGSTYFTKTRKERGDIEPRPVPALSDAECIANARLIAAAPDLLAALGDLRALVKGECPSLLNEDSGGDAALDARIDAAIAKARGGGR